MQPFPCYKCGACCMNVDKSVHTKFLDRGDGICSEYDTNTKLCKIYDKRPDICRIDLQYKRHYSEEYSWNEFVQINLEACKRLEELVCARNNQLEG